VSRPAVQRGTRRLATAAVRRLPVPVADAIRTPLPEDIASSLPGRARLALLRALREGGIPDGVSTFRLVDDPELVFVSAGSLVLSQLYWYGEQGWEPELLPWWRHFCRQSRSILELGANVGYFSVQGGRAAPSARYVAVEPHPVSSRICRSNLDLNAVRSVELVTAAAVADPDVRSVRLLVPSDQLATPTVAFTPVDTELPRDIARDVGASLDVPAVDVRTLLDGVDLLKLDVEGQEHVLLAAAREQLLARHPTIVVEVLPGTSRLRALLADLCRHGYRCYVPTRRRLVELEPAALPSVRLEEEHGTHDLVLCTGRVPLTAAELDAPPPLRGDQRGGSGPRVARGHGLVSRVRGRGRRRGEEAAMTTTPEPIGDSPASASAPTVGRGDHEADIARATGEEIPADAPTDSDGVPVGAADVAADAERAQEEGRQP
jgi:FkbM family methyltransferase